MTKGRLEAFSDGVIAIIITIMVLELKVPHGADLAALRPLAPAFLSYVLSFVYLGIYWNNHHHLLHAARHVDGRILWANLHLLFWLSLFPFVTHWTGENGFAALPVAIYGVVLLMAGFAYWLLVRALIARHGSDSVLETAIGNDFKGNVSLVIYLLAILVGLLVVAKDDETHRALARQFAGRSVEKEYLALVLGVPARKAGVITAPIGRDPVHRKKMSVRAPRGREARSSYTVLEPLDGAALLRIAIHTGRTHQIRVHLASIGHPVAGDEAYGGRRRPASRSLAAREALLALRRPALHAARLAFEHPATHRRMAFESPLPADIEQALERLRA